MSFATYAVPWFLPGIGVSILLGALVARQLGRALGASPFLAWAIVVGAGITISATLTPLRGTLELGAQGGQACDLSRIGLAPWRDLLDINDTSLNVALFVPLGLTLGLLPRSGRKLGAIGAGIALPFVIEIGQLVVVALDRACQSADVFDNATGLLIGVALGSLAGALGVGMGPDGRGEAAPPA